MNRLMGFTPNSGVSSSSTVSTIRFQGFHPDAVVGVDVRAAGAQVPEHEKVLQHLFFAMRKGKVKSVPVKLVREPQNAFDANAVKIVVDQGSQAGKAVGYLPSELARTLAPLMDQGVDRFTGNIFEVKAYPKKEEGGGFGYSAKLRVEWLTAPGRAPNQTLAKQVTKGFSQAYSDAQVNARKANYKYTRVGPIHQEPVSTTTMGKDKITHKLDFERDEVVFYAKGRKVASASLKEPDGPRTRWQQITGQMKRRLAPKIGGLLKKLIPEKPVTFNPISLPQDPMPIVLPKLPEITLESKGVDMVKDSGTPW